MKWLSSSEILPLLENWYHPEIIRKTFTKTFEYLEISFIVAKIIYRTWFFGIIHRQKIHEYRNIFRKNYDFFGDLPMSAYTDGCSANAMLKQFRGMRCAVSRRRCSVNFFHVGRIYSNILLKPASTRALRPALFKFLRHSYCLHTRPQTMEIYCHSLQTGV